VKTSNLTKRNILPVLGIEPRYSGRRVHRLVTIPAEAVHDTAGGAR
jgi:hypothetical protein